MTQRRQHELLPFLAIWADKYQRDYGLDGLHPTHYDLMEKYGARMDGFTRARIGGEPKPRTEDEAAEQMDNGRNTGGRALEQKEPK